MTKRLPALLCVLVLFAAPGAVSAQDTRAGSAAHAPDLQLTTLDGRPARLSDQWGSVGGLVGGQLVVLNFWATWCVPCREEMPMLSALQAAYQARGVLVIGVSVDDASTRGRVGAFVRKHRIAFPVWLGGTVADMERFGLGSALPATAILDRDGTVAARILGPVAEIELRERLDWLLGGREGPAPEALVNNIEKAERRHQEETGHRHGSVAVEGASTVPS